MNVTIGNGAYAIDVSISRLNPFNADVLKVLADPEVKARFNTFAFEPLSWSPEEIRKNADIKSKTYEQLIKRKNISLD
jgi:tripartite-type tricarboxylate transporter receptor subunit TctC